MSCDGHMVHGFEQDDPECTHCGHPRSEHPDDFWPEDRGHHTAPSEETDDASRGDTGWRRP